MSDLGQNAGQPEGTPPRSSLWRHIPGLLALVVLAAACAYFYFLNQYQPNAHGLPGLLSTFGHLFDIDKNPYRYHGGIDWIALAVAAAAAIVLVLVGLLVLSAIDLFIPKTARLALAYVVGMGVVGVLLEVETIFGIHSRETILATLAFVVVLFSALTLYRTTRTVRGGFLSDWGGLRVEIARDYAKRFQETLSHPYGVLARPAFLLLLLGIAAITLLTFYHGALCPITYWDSLILYGGYARQIFLERAFPFKAVAQVGIGLGANYPHLYSLLTAATATVAGRWADSFAQVGPPLAGLFSCVLVYHIALRLTRHRLLALALTAIFRAVPYGIAYFIYASDYAFVMLFVAAFLYVALMYFETTLSGYFILATLIPAFAMHINYLMGGLWIIWGVMILLAHIRPTREPEEEPVPLFEGEEILRDMVELQTAHPSPPHLGRLLLSGRFWGWLFVAVAAASPWYIRNWVLTGNPVYAFFANSLFPNTKNYNQEVMDSAVVEWNLNGDGIGKFSLTPEFFDRFHRFQRAADVSKMEIARIDTPLSRKLALSWKYWVTGFNTWRHAPAFAGLALPGLLLFLLGSRSPRRLDPTDRETVARRRFGWICVLMLILLIAYHYLLADFYLYQIIPFVVLIPLFGAYVARALLGKIEHGAFVALAIGILLFSGLPYALMGFKLLKTVQFRNRVYTQFDLVALHHVGLPKYEFQKLAFGDDADAWVALKTRGLDHNVLTHENRHLAIDPRVGLVHFDDAPVQALWNKTVEEQLEGLRKLGVTYYLFIPNETQHQVNRRLGPPGRADLPPGNIRPWRLSALRGWIGTDVLELVGTYGENRLYRFHYPGESDETTSLTLP